MRLLLTLYSFLILSTAFAKSFELTSPDLKKGRAMNEEQVFDSFGCSGKNISPELNWKNAPKDTKSFALTVYDPDAPTGSGWWHWTVINIPADTLTLAKGAGNEPSKLPAGALQTRTDFGKPGYGGPCPPAGDKTHHYIFTIHALKVAHLDLDADASGAMLGFYLGQNTLEKTSLTVTYQRKK